MPSVEVTSVVDLVVYVILKFLSRNSLFAVYDLKTECKGTKKQLFRVVVLELGFERNFMFEILF